MSDAITFGDLLAQMHLWAEEILPHYSSLAVA